MIGGLAEAFTYRGALGAPLWARCLALASLAASVAIAGLLPGAWLWIPYAAAVGAAEAALAKRAGPQRGLARVARLVAVFLAAAVAARALGAWLWGSPLDLLSAARSTVVFLEAFLLMSIAVQITRPAELARLLEGLGLGHVGKVLMLAVGHLGSVLRAYEDAAAASRLKKGGPSFVRPLVVYAALYGRELSEAIAMYGFPRPAPPRRGGRGGLALALPYAALAAVGCALYLISCFNI